MSRLRSLAPGTCPSPGEPDTTGTPHSAPTISRNGSVRRHCSLVDNFGDYVSHLIAWSIDESGLGGIM